MQQLVDWAKRHYQHALLIFTICVASIYLRGAIIDFASRDFTDFIRNWIAYIHYFGMSRVYALHFSNYAPLYTYFLGIGDVFFPNANPLYLVKGITFVGEIIAAFFVYKIVALHYPGKFKPLLSAMLLLLCPTVIINGSGSAQCDIWYTAFLLASMYYILQKRPVLAMVYAGIAFSFKLQALFLSPLLLILVLRKKVPVWALAIIPLMYILTCIPAWLEGRPWLELLTIYFRKFSQEPIVMGAASPYLYLRGYHEYYYTCMGLLLTVEIALVLAYFGYKKWQEEPTAFTLILWATFCSALMPFVLPKMHDRYFFMADIFSLILACMRPRWFILPVLFQWATLAVTGPMQFPRLHGAIGWMQSIGNRNAMWMNAAAIVILLWLLQKYIWKAKQPLEPKS